MYGLEINKTAIVGCFEIMPITFRDNRGSLNKMFNRDLFKLNGLNYFFEEIYYSVSYKGVLRGLHFQDPPKAHIKLVTCVSGKILDVVCDLRKNSSTYKKVISLELNSKVGNMLYVPEGLAHGFYTLSEKAIFLSMNSKKYSSINDSGIKWDSIGFNWPNINPIVSEKDDHLVKLENYKTPFL